MSQPFSFLDETKNMHSESVTREYNCCDGPFIQETGNGYKCLSCGQCKSQTTTYVYNCEDCKYVDEPTKMMLDLRKDDRTDWTTCKTCNKYVNYRKKVITTTSNNST